VSVTGADLRGYPQHRRSGPREHAAFLAHCGRKRADAVATPPVPGAVDDVVVGRTPATFDLRPKALRLKI
jgi:hypothetical protein